VWALIYYALAPKRVYGGTWGETIGRDALLTMLHLVLPQTVCLEWVGFSLWSDRRRSARSGHCLSAQCTLSFRACSGS